ncbi:hypothetical protein LCGC14_1450010 [marine sediment metagenome]|uniref:Uncharacterized protein n=1 Tax=marine sediment metagenome TaxID=412755 RepID=A0A0F9LYR1_9ZZZZ
MLDLFKKLVKKFHQFNIKFIFRKVNKMFFDDKQMINSTRHFNKSNQIIMLDKLSIQQIIRMFRTRIKDWYIKPGKILSDKKFHLHFDFVLINLCCIIIDTMSQYYFDAARSTGDIFKKFLRKEFPEFRTKLDPTKLVTFYDGTRKYRKFRNIKPLKNHDYAWGFYKAFRNGIVHNGLVLPFGRHNRSDKNNQIISSSWGKFNQNIELKVNPQLLFKNVKKSFRKYIRQLRISKTLQKRFQNKLYRDFGWRSKHFVPYPPLN